MNTTIIEAASAGRAAPTCVMMLSAAFTEPSDFVQNGFATAVGERSLDVDLVFAGFRLEHLIDGSVFERLRDEIIAPAQAPGCRLWLGGISLGAYIALGCARRHEQELAGLCLLAPYLGSHLITGEIERAQGVEGWRAVEPDHEDEDRRIWEFIRTLRTPPAAARSGATTLRGGRRAGRPRLADLAHALGPISGCAARLQGGPGRKRDLRSRSARRMSALAAEFPVWLDSGHHRSFARPSRCILPPRGRFSSGRACGHGQFQPWWPIISCSRRRDSGRAATSSAPTGHIFPPQQTSTGKQRRTLPWPSPSMMGRNPK